MSTTTTSPTTTSITDDVSATTKSVFERISGAVPPPIVYTIAGSDSGGGAGIQADLHAIHAMGCHGCSAVTCLTAQSSVGVTEVHAPPASFLKQQLDTLLGDLGPPRAIKIGMLGTRDLAEAVGQALAQIRAARNNAKEKTWIVFDPVMISTSGHKLIDDDAKEAILQHVFPYTDILTPNKFEAEELLGRKLLTPKDVEEGARDLLVMGVKSVLIKGGHSLLEPSSESPFGRNHDDEKKMDEESTLKATTGYAQDFFLSSVSSNEEERLCDGHRGVWLRSRRYDTEHTHGTGCTLSSAIASALALGHRQRELASKGAVLDGGAISAIYPVDAVCLAKAYVTAGIERGVGLGQGPGPVVHTTFPSTYQHFPTVAVDPTLSTDGFRTMRPPSSSSVEDDTDRIGRLLPIVDTVEWVEELVKTPGIEDIQLRIKDMSDPDVILELVKKCQNVCKREGIRLWINDHWEAAIEAGCYGVHIGQEDLVKCFQQGGLDRLRSSNMALGISTHSYGELSAALGVKPSYISLGPVFGTKSKKVDFDAQGLGIVRKWRQLLPPNIPFVAIGGIGNAQVARNVREAGADMAAVIGAVTQAKKVEEAVQFIHDAMQ